MLVLRPSPKAGVGIFTTRSIAKGEHVRLWQKDDERFVSNEEAEGDPDLRAACDVHCVIVEGGFTCPSDFHRMSIGWYMNHSFTPNIASSAELDWEFYAVRDIDADEELCCDYRTLSPFETVPDHYA